MNEAEKRVCEAAGMTPEQYEEQRDGEVDLQALRARQVEILRRSANRGPRSDRGAILQLAEELERAPVIADADEWASLSEVEREVCEGLGVGPWYLRRR